jgi:DNA-binding PucR family transcriptional regulator
MWGFHSLDAIAVRAAVFSDRDVSESLHRRYIEPLEHCGPFGAVLTDTLRAFFANGLRTDATASDLGIHTNSFRHRLRRYAELTGARIDRTEDLVAIWWAMEREVLRKASRPADASGLRSSPTASAPGHRRYA